MTQTKQQVIVRKKQSGLAVLLIDCPGKVNLLTADAMQELSQALLDVERDPSVKALVIVSGKPDTFVSGADLHEIAQVRDQCRAQEMSTDGQTLCNKLAALGKPTVVGINGVCLGGGLELALACDRRIATDHESTLLGLPEVRLGIIPGMGGTQRLPRLIGLQNALEIILSGEPITASRAKELALVDELVTQDDLLDRCQQAALELIARPATQSQPEDADTAKRTKLLAMAERSARIRTKGQYPAATRVIDVIRHGLEKGIDSGLDIEAQVFGELAVTDVAKNLIALFFNTEFARQTALTMSQKMQTKPVSTVAVIGSGTMGLAIAQLAAVSGHTVLFRQTNRDPNDRPIGRLKTSIERSLQKSDESPDSVMQRVRTVDNDRELESADLIVEAIFEDEDLKVELFNRLEAIVKPDCLIGSNTSSLSIGGMAGKLADSGRFLGLHFFLPVDRMPLVEIICHRATKRDAIARAASFVSRLGKIPIMVNDGPGFLVNRLLCTYLLEAARIAEENVPLDWIDDAAVEFGMAMGPLVVLDEVGLDIAFKVVDTLHLGCGERFAPPAVVPKVRALGLIGKKTGTGVYSWDVNGKRLSFDPRLVSEIGLTVANRKAEPLKSAWIAERLILPMIDEAARCLEDKIVRKPREIDLAMVLGTGFPPFRGGPLKYADSIGMAELRVRLEQIYKADGSRRTPADLLTKMEAEGRRFYSRAADDDG